MGISVANRQRIVALDLKWLRRFAACALEQCLPLSADGEFALRRIAEIEVTIVSDRTIARVHADFMGIAGPTDVITFEHGEIVIGAETARDHARKFGVPVNEEVALYIVHGLLHLNGFDDRTPAARTRMHRVQRGAMKTCVRRLGGA